MEWYYAEGDRQCGPVSESELQQLATSGKVQPDSLVWSEGMDNWAPFSSVKLAPPAPPVLKMAGAVAGSSCSECGCSFSANELVRVQDLWICARCKPKFLQRLKSQASGTSCAECGRPFPPSEMLCVNNTWVCASCKPRFLQRLQEGAPLMALPGSLWRSNKLLVTTTTGSVFPDRCLKCNAPTNGKLMKRTLYWYPPWVIIVLIASVLIGLIVAMLVRKTAKVEIGLCDAHQSKRIRNIIIGSVLTTGGIIFLIVSGINSWGIGALFSVIALIAGIVFLSVARIVSVNRMDNTNVWIKGVCPPFLEGLPEWRG